MRKPIVWIRNNEAERKTQLVGFYTSNNTETENPRDWDACLHFKITTENVSTLISVFIKNPRQFIVTFFLLSIKQSAWYFYLLSFLMSSTFLNRFKASNKKTSKLKVVISSCLSGPCSPLFPSVPFAQVSFVFHQMKGTKATIGKKKKKKKPTTGWANKWKRASWTGERRPELSAESVCECTCVCLWLFLILCEYDTGNERWWFGGGGLTDRIIGSEGTFWERTERQITRTVDW